MPLPFHGTKYKSHDLTLDLLLLTRRVSDPNRTPRPDGAAALGQCLPAGVADFAVISFMTACWAA